MLLIKKWMNTHSLTVNEKASKNIFCVNGIAVQIVGMTNISMLLVPTLEVDLANVTIFLGDFYKGLLGYNIFVGTMRHLAPPPLYFRSQTNRQLSARCKKKWSVLQSTTWSHKKWPW